MNIGRAGTHGLSSALAASSSAQAPAEGDDPAGDFASMLMGSLFAGGQESEPPPDEGVEPTDEPAEIDPESAMFALAVAAASPSVVPSVAVPPASSALTTGQTVVVPAPAQEASSPASTEATQIASTVAAAPSLATPAPVPATQASAVATSTTTTEMAQRFEPLRTALERLRPIPSGGATVEVDLEGLGRVEVRVEAQGEDLRLAVRAEDPATAAVIERQRAELIDVLRSPPAFESKGADLQGRSDGRRHSPGGGTAAKDESPPPPAPRPESPNAARAVTRRRGLVDDLA